MAQIRECSSIELDQRLATSFNRTLSYIRNKDQKAAELLTVAQKSWQKFAEDSCEFSTASRQTSQLANDSRLKCRQSFIEARIRILDSYLMNFGRKDKLR